MSHSIRSSAVIHGNCAIALGVDIIINRVLVISGVVRYPQLHNFACFFWWVLDRLKDSRLSPPQGLLRDRWAKLC